jgi:predicted AAA+ superfamily ATPase
MLKDISNFNLFKLNATLNKKPSTQIPLIRGPGECGKTSGIDHL